VGRPSGGHVFIARDTVCRNGRTTGGARVGVYFRQGISAIGRLHADRCGDWHDHQGRRCLRLPRILHVAGRPLRSDSSAAGDACSGSCPKATKNFLTVWLNSISIYFTYRINLARYRLGQHYRPLFRDRKKCLPGAKKRMTDHGDVVKRTAAGSISDRWRAYAVRLVGATGSRLPDFAAQGMLDRRSPVMVSTRTSTTQNRRG
jgi:hypothetical protein